MFKGELGVSRLLDLDHQRHSPFGAAKRERLACVLERDRVDVLAVAIWTPLDHATTKAALPCRDRENQRWRAKHAGRAGYSSP